MATKAKEPTPEEESVPEPEPEEEEAPKRAKKRVDPNTYPDPKNPVRSP